MGAEILCTRVVQLRCISGSSYSVQLRSLVDETILNIMVAANKSRQTDDSSSDEYNRGAQMETVERALWLLVLLLAVGATHITNQKSLSKEYNSNPIFPPTLLDNMAGLICVTLR